jgi:hypothetical protein
MNVPDNLEEMFNSAVIVKSGKIREVRRNGNIFIKLDRRKNHSFAKEFACAEKLHKAKIPVTEPLFFTEKKSGNYLATKAFEGIPLEKFIKENLPDKEFFADLTALLKKMLDNGFIHKDFHLGNLLYSPETKQFSLVDVDSVCQVPRWFVPLVPQKIRFHILTEFRAILSDTQLLELFRNSGVNKPELFLQKSLKRNAEYIRHHWQRRRTQVLSGYPKFTRTDDNGVIFDSAASADEIAAGETVKDHDAKLFLTHFYLDQIKVPHRRALAFFPESQTVVLAEENKKQAAKTVVDSMIRRLEFYGITTAAEDWRQGTAPLPELNNLKKASILPFITQGK